VFLSEDFYNGYDQQEALNLARKFYEHGTYPESRLAVVKTQDLGGGRYRAFVTATSDKGFPLTGLMASHFAVTTEAGKSYVATQVKRFGDLSDSEIRVELSAVIDDSGSIQDCDAVQIAGGLSNMFDSLPPVYQAELIKFETDIYRAHGFTENGEAIAQRMMSYCTNRGSTALWDAIDLGMDERLAEPDLKIIVVFSDGIDSSSTSEAAEIVANLKKRRIPVFSVALGLADVVNLWNLSAVTGGGFVYIYSGEDILWAFSLMADFLNEIYIIEWESAVPPSGSTISVQKDDGSVISAKI
jgi:hypothetical protein